MALNPQCVRLCGVTADLAAKSHGGERPIFKSWQWQEIECADLQRLERKGQVKCSSGRATEGPSLTIIMIHSHYDAKARQEELATPGFPLGVPVYTLSQRIF